MDFDQFRESILSSQPVPLLRHWLFERIPHAFQDRNHYETFTSAIVDAFPNTQGVYVAGSSNWRFSLNPQKQFAEFHQASDVDTVIVNPESFMECWDAIRSLDRLTCHTRGHEAGRPYRSAGKNIYSGFVAPVWVLAHRTNLRYDFKSRLNKISKQVMAGREVKALYFRNIDEVVDYYVRGVMLAKVQLK